MKCFWREFVEVDKREAAKDSDEDNSEDESTEAEYSVWTDPLLMSLLALTALMIIILLIQAIIVCCMKRKMVSFLVCKISGVATYATEWARGGSGVRNPQ